MKSLLLIILSLSGNAIAQNRTVVIRIDTLTGNFSDSLPVASAIPFGSFDYFPDDDLKSLSFSSGHYFQHLELKSDTLYLQTDDNGGFIRLRHIPDTLYIPRLKIFHTVTPDSVFFNKAMWKVIDDKLADSVYSFEHKAYLKEKDSPDINPPSDYELIINGKIYRPVFYLVSSDEMQITHGHGRWNKGIFKRRRNGKLRRNHFYMSFSEVTVANSWVAETDLGND